MNLVISAQPSTDGQICILLAPARRLHDVAYLTEILAHARAVSLPGRVAVRFAV